jgi:hypothetical protein
VENKVEEDFVGWCLKNLAPGGGGGEF